MRVRLLALALLLHALPFPARAAGRAAFSVSVTVLAPGARRPSAARTAPAAAAPAPRPARPPPPGSLRLSGVDGARAAPPAR